MDMVGLDTLPGLVRYQHNRVYPTLLFSDLVTAMVNVTLIIHLPVKSMWQ